ncbi:hypothetical protein Pan153_49660 [Gimesia panareensis]|uniref:Uncharacterized protein n=1 Tax=Gimesia panareensis TaxID=2527978 RepID=A0A518FVA1_9PLAN|nr:hypothetical protein [Gimesia panareensis]QDV20291.1 hypothetical protein Pan153_49660 [Gimesia panareensis]
MQYVNFVFDDDDNSTLYTGPVPECDVAYLQQAAAHLKPLSDEEYMTGPAAVLHTLAKYSYVLDADDLYWCIEWDPGFVMIRMSPDAELQWVALRSPVPNFGGREPLPEDGNPEEYECDDNPQYNLIFTPWDAQFDEQDREWGAFVPADNEVQTRFENALARVNELGNVMESRYANHSDDWFKLCIQNLEKWCGEGVRLRPAN